LLLGGQGDKLASFIVGARRGKKDQKLTIWKGQRPRPKTALLSAKKRRDRRGGGGCLLVNTIAKKIVYRKKLSRRKEERTVHEAPQGRRDLADARKGEEFVDRL